MNTKDTICFYGGGKSPLSSPTGHDETIDDGRTGVNWLTRERSFKEVLPAWSGREWFGALALVVAVIIAYLPVWQAGFVWDDRFYIQQNPYLVGWSGLKSIWTSVAADISPFTLTTFWVEHALWGVTPLPHHIVNVLLHGGCAVMLWRVLIALDVPGAWLGAGMWALHPVNVESVAWITEMKNTESGLFFLLSILYFIRWLKRGPHDAPAPARWNYGLTLFFAALAMASKSSTVILPGAFCLAAWWIEGRWTWRNLLRVAPVVGLSLAASALSLWTQSLALANMLGPQFVRTWPERIATSGIAVWFYLGKLVWPHPLITIYPRWQIDATQVTSYLPTLAVLVTLLILWLRRESWARAPFFVFAYFIGALFPAIGLLDNYIFHFSIVFDHFQYLPSMAPLALAAACLVRGADFVLPGRDTLQSRLAMGLLLVLGLLTWQRATVFTSEKTLWGDTAEKDPNNWTAHYNLAYALAQEGHAEEAMRHYRLSLNIYPDNPEAHVNVGLLILQQGRIDDAMAEFHTALKNDPKSGEAYNDIGDALLQQGKEDEAFAAFAQAMKVDPIAPKAHYNYGQILLKRGQIDAAIEAFKTELSIDPGYPEVYYSLGMAFSKKGATDGEIWAMQKCLELVPDNADAHDNLGLALVQKGQLNDGVIEYQKALAINPKSGSAETNLGAALFQAGLKNEAMKHLQKAIELDPASDQAHNNLGNAYLASGQVNDAITHYEKALALNASFTDAHRNLGVAYLAKARAPEAIAQFQAVLKDRPTDTITQNLLAKAQAMKPQK